MPRDIGKGNNSLDKHQKAQKTKAKEAIRITLQQKASYLKGRDSLQHWRKYLTCIHLIKSQY